MLSFNLRPILFFRKVGVFFSRFRPYLKFIIQSSVFNVQLLVILERERVEVYVKIRKAQQNQNQKCLLVTRQNDNHSPGPGPGRLVPSSHQRSELSNTILGTFSRGGKRVWKCIPIPNCLGEKAAFITISVSNGNLIYHRMIIPATPSQGG